MVDVLVTSWQVVDCTGVYTDIYTEPTTKHQFLINANYISVKLDTHTAPRTYQHSMYTVTPQYHTELVTGILVPYPNP